jgi:hypothetical protein
MVRRGVVPEKMCHLLACLLLLVLLLLLLVAAMLWT